MTPEQRTQVERLLGEVLSSYATYNAVPATPYTQEQRAAELDKYLKTKESFLALLDTLVTEPPGPQIAVVVDGQPFSGQAIRSAMLQADRKLPPVIGASVGLRLNTRAAQMIAEGLQNTEPPVTRDILLYRDEQQRVALAPVNERQIMSIVLHTFHPLNP